MTARQIYIPSAQPSRDDNGRAVPAKLRFYEPDTDTPATVYTDSGLSVAHAWPIVSDSSGHFGAIWADDANTFDVVWTDSASDVTLGAFTDVSPVNDAVLASVGLAQAAADSAETSATEAAASAADAAATLADTEAFVADFGDISSAVTAASASATSAAASATSATSSATAAAASASSAANIGKQSIWIPATAMIQRVTNGAATGSVETSTNKRLLRTLDFDQSTIEYAQFTWAPPKSWNLGTVIAQFFWSHATGISGVVRWGLSGVAISDNEAQDVATGTPQYVNDTGGTADKLYVSAETSAITITGYPADGDLVIFEVSRLASDAADTLSGDARLQGVRLIYTVDQGNDA